MRSFSIAVVAFLASITVSSARRLSKDSGAKGKKSDTSQQLLSCQSLKKKMTTKSKGSTVEPDGRRLSKGSMASSDIPECPCCNEETCEYFMGFGFCEAEGFAPFDATDSAACKYAVADPYSPSFGSLVGIDLEDFGDDSCCERRLGSSQYDYESFAFCCETFALVSGCCDITRRNRRMNEISATSTRTINETEDGIDVTVEAEHAEGLDWLGSHIQEMQNRMEKGDTARAWDPLFRAYFDNAKDIEMKCEHSDNKLECKTKSQTECGVDLIKAQGEYHRKIAESLRNGGDHIIVEEHLVPESCQP